MFLGKYGLGIKVVVIKNNTLGQIKWEQMVFLGNPEYGCELEPIDFAKVAEACGIRGITVESPMTCVEQLRDALNTPGPCLIELLSILTNLHGRRRSMQNRRFIWQNRWQGDAEQNQNSTQSCL